MSGRIGWWLAGGLLALGAALAWGWWRPTPVPTRTLVEQPVQITVVATGRVAPARETALASTLTGRVRATPVAEGAAVTAGTLLLALDSDEWTAALAQAEAQRRDARGALADAERQARRQRELQAQGFLSPAALDGAERALDAARRRLEQTTASVAQARAKLDQAQVRAPADGVLLQRLVEVGDGVTAGRALLRFAVAGPPRILLDLDERDLGQLAVGQSAAVRADAWPDERLPARVQRIAAQVDSARGTVEVELTPEGDTARLLPGMTVSAEVVTAAPRPQLLLPLTALRDGRVATVVDGRLRWRAVDTAPAIDGQLPVRGGLTAGAVVVDPAPGLAEGARVEARP